MSTRVFCFLSTFLIEMCKICMSCVDMLYQNQPFLVSLPSKFPSYCSVSQNQNKMANDWALSKTNWRLTGLKGKQNSAWLASMKNQNGARLASIKNKNGAWLASIKNKMAPDWPQWKKNGHRLGSVLNKIMTDLHLFKIKWLLTGLCRKNGAWLASMKNKMATDQPLTINFATKWPLCLEQNGAWLGSVQKQNGALTGLNDK